MTKVAIVGGGFLSLVVAQMLAGQGTEVSAFGVTRQRGLPLNDAIPSITVMLVDDYGPATIAQASSGDKFHNVIECTGYKAAWTSRLR